MKTEIVKNKEGEILTTKDGVQLTESFFEVGDVFIPKNDSLVKDKNSKFDKYKVIANVKDKEGNEYTEVFVTLSPAQVKAYNKARNEDGVIPNQELWHTYEYHSKEYNKDCIGISCRVRKEAKTFSDFEE